MFSSPRPFPRDQEAPAPHYSTVIRVSRKVRVNGVIRVIRVIGMIRVIRVIRI